MWRIVTVLGLWLCCTTAALATGTAEYRFQALVDRDQSVQTGCDVESPAGTMHGYELRVYAETDRAQVLRVVAEQCESGLWRQLGSDEGARSLGLGQGRLGSDVVEWEIQRDWLAGARSIEMVVLGQNIASGAFDVVGNGDGSGPVQMSFDGITSPAPLFGPLGAVLVFCGVVLIARRHKIAVRSRVVLPLLELLAFAVVAIVPIRDSQAGLSARPVEITDLANDSVGKDAGVDFISASIRDNGTAIVVRVELNNIEADGLANGSKVLFIGNSLTYANYLPAMLSAVAAQAGKTLVTAQVSEGGYALQDHYRVGTAQAEIGKHYQLVILQQGPSAEESSQADLRRSAIRFDPIIRNSGARPALYMVWPELARFSVFDDVRESYSNAALAIDAMFIPGGEAWRASWHLDPALELYGPDDFHPSTLGTYAIAVSMFAEIFRQMPEDLPATFSLANGTQIALDPAQARAVQRGAWQAHLQFGRAGK
jgi:hypothetical protein